ncbi:MAG: hypothetical protein GF311_17205 [Candidatus Lokiarchaeota archaeon]|nr:hypothetical protein [Candidatus Lokiarchaeota archaeon]
MNWSISKAKLFSKCQRRWFYSEIMASKHSKDTDRYEAYILKQLGSIHSWRGKLVDYVIETLLLPNFNENIVPPFKEIERLVSGLMKKQLRFAKQKKYRDPKLSKKEAGNGYCALREIEWSEGLDNKSIKEIKGQVISSLQNLLKSKLMKTLLAPDSILVAQKNLYFKFKDVNVLCRPDLIVYFRNKPPMIIDWKVYFYRNENARMQLGVYAISLTDCISTDPFMKLVDDPTEIKLIEYQLLKDFQRKYRLSTSDVDDIKEYIKTTSNEMFKLKGDKNYHEFNINHFEKTSNTELCKYCNFKTLCKNEKVKYQVNLMKYMTN